MWQICDERYWLTTSLLFYSVIVVSPTTWEFHHSPRVSPSGCGELPRSLVAPQWPQSWYQFLYPINLHPFRSMSIGLAIPVIQHFQILTLRSRVRVMLKVTIWVQHSIDSHPFGSMGIGHPIPDMTFSKLTLKIQGQGHGWGQSWKSQSGCNIILTHISFVPCQLALQFLKYSIFKIWPWKSKVKVMGEVDIESHNMGQTFYQTFYPETTQASV